MNSTRLRAAVLEDRLHDRKNNFDVLRLVAASLVLFSHCYPLTGHEEPVAATVGWTLGQLGVVMFFVMSGFLISKSWSDQPQLGPFFVKRALRLLPALAVVTALTVLLLGPLFTTLSPAAYFSQTQTWTYLVRASLLLTIDGQLPGVFTDNVLPNAVNGSLWTLPVEACCYALAAVLGLFGLLRRSSVMLAAFLVAFVCITPMSPLPDSVGSTATGGSITLVIMLVTAFVFGALLYSLRGRLRLRWWVLALLTLVWVLSWGDAWVTAAGLLAVGYGVLVLAFRTPSWWRRLTAPGDVSYGIYVYAFPVQQSVAALWGPELEPLVMLVVALPVTYVLALLSWRLVEKPALSLKRRLLVPPRRAPAPAAAARR